MFIRLTFTNFRISISINDFYKSINNTINNFRKIMKTRFENFMNNSIQFDYFFFEIFSRKTKSIDSQQQIFLQTKYKILKNVEYVFNSSFFLQKTFLIVTLTTLRWIIQIISKIKSMSITIQIIWIFYLFFILNRSIANRIQTL